MRMILLIGASALIPSMLTAQQWQSMEGPYFVYNVTGISIGWTDFGQPGQQLHAYAVGSDLEHEYIYRYQGDSPLQEWQGSHRIDGVKLVAASRYYGNRGYAAVPEGAGGNPGILFTDNGGQTWIPTISQPGNVLFTGITAHPGNTNICFTTSEQDSPDLSLWRTTDTGLNWSSIGGQDIPNPTLTSNSLRIDPNSENTIGETTVYACYDGQGIWKSTNGGSNWTGLSLPGYGTNYDGLDVTIEDGDADNVYALVRHSGDYEIWHSTNGGSSWGVNYLHSFGTVEIKRIFRDEVVENHTLYDALWIVGHDYIYIYHGNHGIGDAGDGHGPFLAADSDPNFSNDFDNLFLASKYSIQTFGYSADAGGYVISIEEVVQGTNKMNTVSIDACQSGYLRMIGIEGGYIVKNQAATEGSLINRSQWKTDDYFQRLAESGIAYGEKISSYLNNTTPSYIGSGTISSSPYLIDTGIEVNLGTPPALNIAAVTGPHYPTPGYTAAFTAGQNSFIENVAWFVQRSPYRHLVELLNLNTSPPVIKDIIRDLVFLPNYYICGSRISDLETIAAYVINNYPDPSTVVNLNGGLGDPYHVRDAYSILRSNENDNQSGNFILYLGTDKGVFKNRYNPQLEPWPWYQASYGINANVEIAALANYYHILKNFPYNPQDPIPDSVIQFALGHDLSQQPYIYVSPDSGRSWNEIGQFFRVNNIAVNDITTFTDVREPLYQFRPFLGVGTDDGVYRLPYNIRSGEITGTETWNKDFYIINRELLIPAGATLNIGPNTTVLVLYDYPSEEYGCDQLPIVVDGRLEATGVTFKSSRPLNAGPGDWQGFLVGQEGELYLSNCVIENAEEAIRSEYGAVVSIDGCEIIQPNGIGLTALNPQSLSIIGTTFINNKVYSIGVSLTDETCQDILISGVDILGEFINGIRFFGLSPRSDIPKIENVNIITEDTPEGIGILISDNEFGAPQGVISNTSIFKTNCAIYITGSEEAVTIGPGVQCQENKWAGIIVENAVANIEGSLTEPNAFKKSERGIAGVTNDGRVRWTDLGANYYGGELIDCHLDFGNDEFEDPGMNSFEDDESMFLYVMDSPYVLAQWNWWGTTELGEIYEKVTEYVIVEPILEDNPLAKLSPKSANLPNKLKILSTYPNPFNANVTIELSSPIPTLASLKVYNILGQEIAEIYNGHVEAGNVSIVWDGRDNSGDATASGVYFCIVRTDDQKDVKKLMLLK